MDTIHGSGNVVANLGSRGEGGCFHGTVGCSFEVDVTDLMDRCQMSDTLSKEEVQIISYYLDLAAGEEEVGEEGEGNQ